MHFGHHDKAPGGMRPNEQVLGQYKTHHGEFQVTNQRCLLLKAAGGLGHLEGKHEIAWGVDLEAIQNIQVVGGSTNAAAQAGTEAAGNATSSTASNRLGFSIGNPMGALAPKPTANLIIDGQIITFHEQSHADTAQAQIQSAIQSRKQALGQA